MILTRLVTIEERPDCQTIGVSGLADRPGVGQEKQETKYDLRPLIPN